MSIALVVFWALFLCLVITLTIITFPASFARDSMKKGARRIQRNFIIFDTVACILVITFNQLACFTIHAVDAKIALMLIPVTACVVFSVFLYYPSVRFLVNSNLDDKKTIDELITLIFSCVYGDRDNRNNALSALDIFCMKQEQFINQYGLNVYLSEYKNHTDAISSKPSIELTNYVLARCSQVKHDIDYFDPVPFPNIGLILSFVFSTVLTVLLSIITITP